MTERSIGSGSAIGAPRARTQAGSRVRLPPVVAVAVLMALSLGVLLYVSRGETFHVADEFSFAFYRHTWSPDGLLQPYNGHLMALPNAIFNLLLDVGRLDDYLVYRVGTMPLSLICGGLVFVYARRRVGDWPAVAATGIILFFGAAWQALLVPIGALSFVLPVAAGVGALVALDRDDRVGDGLACGLLVIGLLSQSVALVFVGLIVIDLLLDRRRWRRLWVTAVPLAVYGAWYGAYSHRGEARPVGLSNLENFEAIPRFLIDGTAWTFGDVFGPTQIARALGAGLAVQHAIGLAVAVVVVAAAVLLIGLARVQPARRRLWALLAAFLAFWLVTGLVRGESSQAPAQSRYLYPSAVLLLLILVEAFQGVRISRVALAVTLVVATVSIVGGVIALRDYGKLDRENSRRVAASLAVLEAERTWIASRHEWEFRALPQLPTAGTYLLNTYVYSSSAALNPQQLPRLPAPQGAVVDAELERLLGIHLEPTDQAPPSATANTGAAKITRGRCVQSRSAEPVPRELTIRANVVLLGATNAGPVRVWLRRFGDLALTRTLGDIPTGARMRLRLPSDPLAPPWRLSLTGGPATVCGAR